MEEDDEETDISDSELVRGEDAVTLQSESLWITYLNYVLLNVDFLSHLHVHFTYLNSLLFYFREVNRNKQWVWFHFPQTSPKIL